MYGTFEHPADIGIYGDGKTIEESFKEIAKALFSVEVELKDVKKKKNIKLKIIEETKEILLYAFLSELLAQSDIKDMLFCDFDINIQPKNNKYALLATCYGDKKNKTKAEIKTEVKAITFSQLEIIETKTKIISRCIVDV